MPGSDVERERAFELFIQLGHRQHAMSGDSREKPLSGQIFM